MEIPTLRWVKPDFNGFEPNAVWSFRDNSVSVGFPTSANRPDGDHSPNRARRDVLDDPGRTAIRIGRSLPAQLLFDVPVPGDVVLAGPVLPEPVRGPDVHVVLADSVVLRDRYVAGAGAEGVFDCVVRGGVHDAAVPVGIHIHAAYEHAFVPVVVVMMC